MHYWCEIYKDISSTVSIDDNMMCTHFWQCYTSNYDKLQCTCIHCKMLMHCVYILTFQHM